MESWEARIKNMQDHKSRLMAEIAKLFPEVIDLIPNVSLNSPTAPAVSSAEDPFLTPSHQSFPILNTPDICRAPAEVLDKALMAAADALTA